MSHPNTHYGVSANGRHNSTEKVGPLLHHFGRHAPVAVLFPLPVPPCLAYPSSRDHVASIEDVQSSAPNASQKRILLWDEIFFSLRGGRRTKLMGLFEQHFAVAPGLDSTMWACQLLEN